MRHQLIESLVSERRASLPVDLVTCPSCQQGMIYIEEKFYDHLGMDRSYLKRKAVAEKKNSYKKATSNYLLCRTQASEAKACRFGPHRMHFS